MVFGSEEHFDYIYSKIKHEDYRCHFYYNVLKERVEVTFFPMRFKNVHSSSYITKNMWDDVFYRNYWLQNVRPNFLKSLKNFKESKHLQVSSKPNVPVSNGGDNI